MSGIKTEDYRGHTIKQRTGPRPKAGVYRGRSFVFAVYGDGYDDAFDRARQRIDDLIATTCIEEE